MWREITEDDVLAALNAPETAAYQRAAIAPGQDVLQQIIEQVVQESRGHIADCPQNALAAGHTLPERVIYHALAMIRYRLMTRLNLEVSDDRRREQRDAIQFFTRVSECKVSLEQPAGATEPSGGVGGIETISSRERIANRQSLSGL
jgi:phage gp36-like protein